MLYRYVTEKSYGLTISEEEIKAAANLTLGLIDGMPVGLHIVTKELVCVPDHEFARHQNRNPGKKYDINLPL